MRDVCDHHPLSLCLDARVWILHLHYKRFNLQSVESCFYCTNSPAVHRLTDTVSFTKEKKKKKAVFWLVTKQQRFCFWSADNNQTGLQESSRKSTVLCSRAEQEVQTPGRWEGPILWESHVEPSLWSKQRIDYNRDQRSHVTFTSFSYPWLPDNSILKVQVSQYAQDGGAWDVLTSSFHVMLSWGLWELWHCEMLWCLLLLPETLNQNWSNKTNLVSLHIHFRRSCSLLTRICGFNKCDLMTLMHNEGHCFHRHHSDFGPESCQIQWGFKPIVTGCNLGLTAKMYFQLSFKPVSN